MGQKLLYYFLIILITITGCSGPAIISSWQNDEIIIDGSRQDWNGGFSFIEDEQVAVAMKNDDNYLYLCLATSDRSKIMNIMQMGFTVWLDPLDSDGQTIGVQYPVKREKEPRPNMQLGDNQEDSRGNLNNEKMFNNLKNMQNEILIVNEDNFPLTAIPTKNIEGIGAEVGNEMNQFIYELRVPLTYNKINAVFLDALPGEEIKVTFETGEIQKPERNDSEMRGNSGSGMTGRGGRGGGMRGGGQNRMQAANDPIDFNVEVKLSGTSQL